MANETIITIIGNLAADPGLRFSPGVFQTVCRASRPVRLLEQWEGKERE